MAARGRAVQPASPVECVALLGEYLSALPRPRQFRVGIDRIGVPTGVVPAQIAALLKRLEDSPPQDPLSFQEELAATSLRNQVLQLQRSSPGRGASHMVEQLRVVDDPGVLFLQEPLVESSHHSSLLITPAFELWYQHDNRQLVIQPPQGALCTYDARTLVTPLPCGPTSKHFVARIFGAGSQVRIPTGWYYGDSQGTGNGFLIPRNIYLDDIGRPVLIDVNLNTWERRIVSFRYPTEHALDPAARSELPSITVSLEVQAERLVYSQLSLSQVTEGPGSGLARTVYVGPNTRAIGPRGTRTSYGTDRSKWPSEALPFVRDER